MLKKRRSKKLFTQKRSLSQKLCGFMKSFDIPQRFITETRLAMDPPALLIRPALDISFGVEDVHRLDEAVDLGYRAAVAALDGWDARAGRQA